jgi:hypothetical protein
MSGVMLTVNCSPPVLVMEVSCRRREAGHGDDKLLCLTSQVNLEERNPQTKYKELDNTLNNGIRHFSHYSIVKILAHKTLLMYIIWSQDLMAIKTLPFKLSVLTNIWSPNHLTGHVMKSQFCHVCIKGLFSTAKRMSR